MRDVCVLRRFSLQSDMKRDTYADGRVRLERIDSNDEAKRKDEPLIALRQG